MLEMVGSQPALKSETTGGHLGLLAPWTSVLRMPSVVYLGCGPLPVTVANEGL